MVCLGAVAAVEFFGSLVNALHKIWAELCSTIVESKKSLLASKKKGG